jgi:hypothetical protein
MNEIQVWSIDGMMLTAENGNIPRKTFLFFHQRGRWITA